MWTVKHRASIEVHRRTQSTGASKATSRAGRDWVSAADTIAVEPAP